MNRMGNAQPTATTNNESLCNRLNEKKCFGSTQILDAFRSVDRGEFVNERKRHEAYLESPFKSGDIHLSAPSMYTKAIESLDLQPGQSVLIIGSGTGYFACIASYLVGRTGLVHGVEVKSSLVQHSRTCIERWKDSCGIHRRIDIVEGNAFNIDVIKAVHTCLYDRIYIGAGCPDRCKNYFYSLLADHGNLVAPITDTNRFIFVHKYCERIYQEKEICHCYFAPMVGFPSTTSSLHSVLIMSLPSEENKRTMSHEEETTAEKELQQISKHSELFIVPMTDCIMLEGDEEPALLKTYSHHSFISLPPLVWSPTREIHRLFPHSFRQVVKLFLFANVTPMLPNASPMSRNPVSVGCITTLPLAVCFHILSYCSRDFFIAKKTAMDLLRLELIAERAQSKHLRLECTRLQNLLSTRGIATPRSTVHPILRVQSPTTTTTNLPPPVVAVPVAGGMDRTATEDGEEERREVVEEGGEAEDEEEGRERDRRRENRAILHVVLMNLVAAQQIVADDGEEEEDGEEEHMERDGERNTTEADEEERSEDNSYVMLLDEDEDDTETEEEEDEFPHSSP